jgi:hypothetical protein
LAEYKGGSLRRLIDTSQLTPSLKRALKAPRVLTASLRVLPDFIIIGAQRCGTTSLYRYVARHPRVVPAFRKEVHFFCKNFAKGLNWYREHFPTAVYKRTVEKLLGRRVLTGEATTDYILHPAAAERVFSTIPKVKLIVILRNPADRAYSHYVHEVRRGRETLTFEAAVKLEPDRIKGGNGESGGVNYHLNYNYLHYSYVTRGIYVDQLKPWLAIFPRERILIFASEDFYADPPKVLAQTQEYLGLERKELKTYEKYNYRGYVRLEAAKHEDAAYPPISVPVRRALVDFFAPHNQRLYELLRRDFHWDC